MMSQLVALVAFIDTLSLMEARRQNVLKFPPQVAFTVLSILMNGYKNFTIQGTC